ncbi:MAG TPA: hypothetical protein VLR90_00985, partial [Blastocatellia bacterium]|nr:hypothetical protein [Blastocatellia bacterium]
WATQEGGMAVGILLAAGGGALGVQLGGMLPTLSGDPDVRPDLGLGDPVEADVLPSAVGLVWRALILWLLLILLLTLANWVFERLGFRRSFRYQKYRTTYTVTVEGREAEVAFDETPMGNFIEIEGDEAQVLRILERAGFSAEEIIRESYPELQASRCRSAGVPLEDLVF